MAPRPSTSPRALARRVAKLTALQYQLRIELEHVEPLIWRRILIPENVTLARLHAILLGAMGWGGGHLHEFHIARCRYGTPDEEDWRDDDPLFDERRFRLNRFVETGLRRFTYLYDFGDGWEHTVKVEDLVPPSSNGALIRCIAGENACPPDDVGGPDGYAEFLAAINDPGHEEHASMLKWIGGSFDPAAFDVANTNERLSTIKT